MGENRGHGHVYPRPDGVRARCGGPAICRDCALDAARKAAKLRNDPGTTRTQHQQDEPSTKTDT